MTSAVSRISRPWRAVALVAAVCDEPGLHLVALGDHVTGPFDMKLAPNARGLFLGDYIGLKAIGDDLLAFFAITQGDSANATRSEPTAEPEPAADLRTASARVLPPRIARDANVWPGQHVACRVRAPARSRYSRASLPRAQRACRSSPRRRSQGTRCERHRRGPARYRFERQAGVSAWPTSLPLKTSSGCY